MVFDRDWRRDAQCLRAEEATEEGRRGNEVSEKEIYIRKIRVLRVSREKANEYREKEKIANL